MRNLRSSFAQIAGASFITLLLNLVKDIQEIKKLITDQNGTYDDGSCPELGPERKMVGHAEGLLHARESQIIEDEWLEVENVGGVVVGERRETGCTLPSWEPGYLIGMTDFAGCPEYRSILLRYFNI